MRIDLLGHADDRPRLGCAVGEELRPAPLAPTINARMQGAEPGLLDFVLLPRDRDRGKVVGILRPRRIDRDEVELVIDSHQLTVDQADQSLWTAISIGHAPDLAYSVGSQLSICASESFPFAILKQSQTEFGTADPETLTTFAIGLEHDGEGAILAGAKQRHRLPLAVGQRGARDASLGGQPEQFGTIGIFLQFDSAHCIGGQAVAAIKYRNLLIAESQQAAA